MQNYTKKKTSDSYNLSLKKLNVKLIGATEHRVAHGDLNNDNSK